MLTPFLSLLPLLVAIKGIPAPGEWKNTPVHAEAHEDTLTIAAGKFTDWYISPVDRRQTTSAPILLFPPAHDFVLTTKVSVDFRTQWDAGALFVYIDDHQWAKFALEMAVYKKPTIVSVVTKGVSDDCNSWSVEGGAVWLKLARLGEAFGFYASRDGRTWEMIRAFTFGEAKNVRVGFSAQSPIGPGAQAVFSNIVYTERKVKDIFTGE
jgi:regulation of enolase protein 1 (concanavalin A-like superfamily)